jgi:hypothetical protein
MPAQLTWLDHDSSERDRMNRVLALFQERSTVDEMGLGGIRDSIADLLFPGTSTIQTRLRYFLFVPWIYRRLEQNNTPSSQMAAKARQMELRLVVPLLSEEEFGIFGRRAGGELKRLPSGVYWGGLGIWGIRTFTGSQDQYHRAADEIYRRRRFGARMEDDESGRDRTLRTWHAALPPEPPDFPDTATIQVTHEEAAFLLDRIRTSHDESFLRVLASLPAVPDADFPWQLADAQGSSTEHQRLLHHARMFSDVRQGSAVLYNLMLAELARNPELEDVHTRGLSEWAEKLDMDFVRSWSLDEFWNVASHPSHRITPTTRDFLSRWLAEVQRDPHSISSRPAARELVRRREMMLKGGHSRFSNLRTREEWSGHAGTGRIDYRWFQIVRLLNDLQDGLRRD